uniref:Uncharacterized protein n=1 Tax=Amphimedon queenslandica TaxID=400682 RepID=A0A1X7TCY7_AMPQE
MMRRNREIRQRQRTSIRSLFSSQRRTPSRSPRPLGKCYPPTTVRGAFPCPSLKDTRCPKLDSIFKGASIQETKALDAELARVQALIHDLAGPFIRLLHSFDD